MLEDAVDAGSTDRSVDRSYGAGYYVHFWIDLSGGNAKRQSDGIFWGEGIAWGSHVPIERGYLIANGKNF
ncbi:hypothetical protein UN63_06005 [Oceanisphaera arctica]|uniref:Uncharacterized protein n=1 Tax=Oceanisphaera arctica TaxID=641510 RepID=A0A2P5TNH5_9GAMM|nr:hypothetical protein UN63_06005 [Oceanisphaera arctica]GHA04275.1 hypothetical protein GCM10007082_01250 [Oceanisphaera arctica]